MREKTFLCIGMSLFAISVNTTVWAEETVWETSNDGANEQWGESQTDSSQAVETQQENWQEGADTVESSAFETISETVAEESTEATQEYVKPLGWSINAEAVAGDYRSQIAIEGGYYTDGRVWVSASGTVPIKQEDDSVIEKPFSVPTVLQVDLSQKTCSINALGVAGILDQLTDGQTFCNLTNIWTQGGWVSIPMPMTEEGEGLWDGILTSLQAWFPEGQRSVEVTDVKSAFPKWWADQMESSIAGFLDICEPTGLYSLYQTVVSVPEDGTAWEQQVKESPSARSLLDSYWSTVDEEAYESGKSLLFGSDTKGLSSYLSINAEDPTRGSAVYTRRLYNQDLVRVSVFWNQNVDNVRESEWPEWTLSIDELKDNYLVLMDVQGESSAIDESIPETDAQSEADNAAGQLEGSEDTQGTADTDSWSQTQENTEAWAETSAWEETDAAQ